MNATGHFVGIFYESVLVRSDSIEQDWSIRARDEGNLIGCDVQERLKGAIYIGKEPKREGTREVVSRYRWSLVSSCYTLFLFSHLIVIATMRFLLENIYHFLCWELVNNIILTSKSKICRKNIQLP